MTNNNCQEAINNLDLITTRVIAPAKEQAISIVNGATIPDGWKEIAIHDLNLCRTRNDLILRIGYAKEYMQESIKMNWKPETNG